PRLAGQQNDPPLGRLRLLPTAYQHIEVLGATDKRVGAGPQRLEAAQYAALPKYTPGILGFGETSEQLRPKVSEVEQPAYLTAGAVRDDDRVGLGQTLHASRQVRCLPDNSALLRGTSPD